MIVDFERYPFCEVQRFDGIFFKENKSQIKKHDQSWQTNSCNLLLPWALVLYYNMIHIN